MDLLKVNSFKLSYIKALILGLPFSPTFNSLSKQCKTIYHHNKKLTLGKTLKYKHTFQKHPPCSDATHFIYRTACSAQASKFT